MAETEWLFSLADVVAKLPDDPELMPFHYALRHGTMKIGLYAPRDQDKQGPHKQDELYLVASGSGFFVKNAERRPVHSQDIIFVEAGADHRFEEFTADFRAWVIFWGPEGGEIDRQK